jgi:hypothetical protein
MTWNSVERAQRACQMPMCFRTTRVQTHYLPKPTHPPTYLPTYLPLHFIYFKQEYLVFLQQKTNKKSCIYWSISTLTRILQISAQHKNHVLSDTSFYHPSSSALPPEKSPYCWRTESSIENSLYFLTSYTASSAVICLVLWDFVFAATSCWSDFSCQNCPACRHTR